MARRTASRFCVQSECLRLPFGKGRSRRSRRSLVFRGPFLSCSAGFPACATLECEFDPPYFICSPSDSRWRRAPIFNERGPFPPDGSGIEKRTKGESIPWRLCRVALTSACSLRNGGGDPFVYRSRASMPKFFIKTYGCQMNERDSEQVARSLIDRGYAPAASEAEADIVLLNTCSVRDMAEQKALGKMGMLGRLAKERPGMVFGFLGCMAQARGAELLRATPHLDLVVGTQKFHRVAEYVEELVARKRAIDDPRFSIVDTANEAGSQETIRDHTLRPQQAAAFVSIMQGCNMHCTFCIVPRTRGVERSRSIAAIVREVRALVDRGVKEVTLLG